jgi:hypothetical protein
MRLRAAIFWTVLPLSATAQEPLSAIDWLNRHPRADWSGDVLLEPPVTDNGTEPPISVSPLEVLAPPIGLVPASVTGLPADIWQASEVANLARLISDVPVLESPAMQTLLYTLLLAETVPPSGNGAAETLLLARIDRLMDLGAVDPAEALLEQAGPTATRERFRRWFDATLLTGDEDRACAALNAQPHLSEDYSARIFCAARGGDWSAAAVMLDGARALGLLPQAQLFLLDRFLNPDLYDNAPPLPQPTDPDPLTFRIFEAIGEPVSTAALSRAFAVADLRDLAGWKAQLEAAERLTRSGALSPNRLLGLYTARLPAASGGIWDRVAALQRFDSALDIGGAEAIETTLPEVWAAMRQARLEVPFARLYADDLAALPPTNAKTAALIFDIRLLSSGYKTAAKAPPDTPRAHFLAALARGAPVASPGLGDLADSIVDGFSDPAIPPPEIQALLDAGQKGAAILKAMGLFNSGANGNPTDLGDALASFRAVGLNDTARRAALQLMLLDRDG